tara:strand:+ start:867 stop:1796 length:930 start_codon:yes stop_codon:yes gene_type:complete
MMLLTWPDGLETIDGAPARELVQPSVWSSAVFITRHGDAFRRYFNAVSHTWSDWEVVPTSLDADCVRSGYAFAATGWMSVEQAIATAWQHRAPDSTARVRVVDLIRPLDATNVVWGVAQEEEEDAEADPEGGDFEGETWETLEWCCGLVLCNPQYQVSSHGRLKSPNRDVTRGFAFFGTRWASVRGAGLVNLPAAAGLVRVEVAPAPRVLKAYRSICARVGADQHAKRFDVSVRAAWSYYALAAVLVPDVHVYAPDLVTKDLWRLLLRMRRDAEAVVGGKLTDLQAEVSRRLRREVSFEELRFARICAV